MSSSSKLNDVISSKLETLSSILPMSLMVNLRLSTTVITISSTSYKYAGISIVATVIPVSISSGVIGFSDEIPFNISNSPLV